MVLPANWQAVTLFSSLSTQWRMCQFGPTGLDYAVLPDVFRIHQLPEDEWREMFGFIRIMELAALDSMSKKD